MVMTAMSCSAKIWFRSYGVKRFYGSCTKEFNRMLAYIHFCNSLAVLVLPVRIRKVYGNGDKAVMLMVDYIDYSDAFLRDILTSVKTIALLGASPNPERPSFGVMRFLLAKGFHVIPVNPGQADKQINGQTVVARLADIDEPIDMVDVFRASDALPGIVDEVLALKIQPKVLWTQLDVRDDVAAARAEAAGLKVVMDRCPAIEYPRLIG